MVTRKDANRDFYGTKVSAEELLLGDFPAPKAAEPLYKALEEVRALRALRAPRVDRFCRTTSRVELFWVAIFIEPFFSKCDGNQSAQVVVCCALLVGQAPRLCSSGHADEVRVSSVSILTDVDSDETILIHGTHTRPALVPPPHFTCLSNSEQEDS